MNNPSLKYKSSRRDFLRNAAVASGGAALGVLPLLGAQQQSVPLNKWASQIGIELYTVRDRMETEFEGTLAKLSEMGYKEIEPANGYNNMTPAAFRELLDKYGLTAPSTHSQPVTGDGLEKELEGFQIMGIRYTSLPTPPRVITPGRKPGSGMLGAYFGGHNSFTQAEAFGPLQRPISTEEAKRRAGELNKYGKISQKFGIKMLVHNHTGEFEKLTDGDGSEYDVYLQETDPALVAMQLDLGWATISGQDIAAMFRKNPGRYELWHIKDMFGIQKLDKTVSPLHRIDAVTFEPYGVGQINYRPFFELAGVAGLKHFCVEQDNAATWGDSLAAARISHDNLKTMLAEGALPNALYH